MNFLNIDTVVLQVLAINLCGIATGLGVAMGILENGRGVRTRLLTSAIFGLQVFNSVKLIEHLTP
jgi:hypothetical protein